MNSNANVSLSATARRAFTIVELLVVVAVMAILAGLIFTAIPAIEKRRVLSMTRSEMEGINTAIEAYKAKYGTYPPSSPNSLTNHSLYYELVGVVSTNIGAQPFYVSRDGAYSIAQAIVHGATGVGGIVNSSTALHGTDEEPASIAFLEGVGEDSYRTGANNVRFLKCSTADASWNYNSANPTNNPTSYDLWVDVVVRGTTNRIGNWTR